jgi:hypothetical protein
VSPKNNTTASGTAARGFNACPCKLRIGATPGNAQICPPTTLDCDTTTSHDIYYTKVCSANLCFASKIFNVRTDTQVQAFAFSKCKPVAFYAKYYMQLQGCVQEVRGKNSALLA